MVVITEEKLGKFFAKAFKDVVLPALEDMEERLASKKDLNELNLRVEGVEGNLTNLEAKVDKGFKNVNERIDKLGKTLAVLDNDAPTRDEFEDLTTRVKKVEVKVASI